MRIVTGSVTDEEIENFRAKDGSHAAAPEMT
jgi:hypothetical protein